MSEYTDEHTGGSEDGVSIPDTTNNSAGSEDGLTLSLTPVSAASSGTPSSNISARVGSESESSSGDVGYFAQRGITAGPKEDFASMFNRLAIREGWSKKQRNKHRTEAIVGELEVLYGTNNEKLEKWQELCRDVGIDPAPPSITQCKKALSKVYVNLVNLIDHRRNRNVPLRVFPDYHAFRTWTLGGKNRSRIFPKKAAKAEGFIKALLRDLQLH